MSRSEAPPVLPASEQFMHHVNAELRSTRDFLMRTDSRQAKKPVVRRLEVPVEYDPEDVREITLQPVCHQKRWWPIPGIECYGMTEDAILTVTTANGIIYPVSIAQAEVPSTLIHHLEQMRRF